MGASLLSRARALHSFWNIPGGVPGPGSGHVGPLSPSVDMAQLVKTGVTQHSGCGQVTLQRPSGVIPASSQACSCVTQPLLFVVWPHPLCLCPFLSPVRMLMDLGHPKQCDCILTHSVGKHPDSESGHILGSATRTPRGTPLQGNSRWWCGTRRAGALGWPADPVLTRPSSARGLWPP